MMDDEIEGGKVDAFQGVPQPTSVRQRWGDRFALMSVDAETLEKQQYYERECEMRERQRLVDLRSQALGYPVAVFEKLNRGSHYHEGLRAAREIMTFLQDG